MKPSKDWKRYRRAYDVGKGERVFLLSGYDVVPEWLPRFLGDNYPAIPGWKTLPTDIQYLTTHELIDQKQRAWLLIHLGRPDLAEILWINRVCDNESHNVCDCCGRPIDFMQGLYTCFNDDCPWVHGSGFPWQTEDAPHVARNDKSCGASRWDAWDDVTRTGPSSPEAE